jgi:phage tail protein X
MTNMESVIATGLGAVDYKAAGANTATDLTFTNQQNFLGYAGNMDLRGTNGVATTTAASTELTFTTAGGIVTTATFAGTLTLAQAFAQLVATNPGIAAGATAPAVVVTAGTTTTAGGSNTLYAYTGKDLIEGRAGDDFLSGGEGDDDFVFQISGTFGTASGDGVDVIHRQLDANADNIWDTGFGQDFGQVSVAVTANSKLTLTLTDTANPASLTGFPVNGVVISLGGVVYSVALTSGVQGTYAAFTAGLNAALDANPALAALDAVLNTNNTITITDPAGKTFAVVPNVTGYTFVNNVVPSAGSLVWTTAVGDPSVSQTQDRLIFAAYEDRADGELVDDNGMVNSTGDAVTLGTDGYAEDLVVRFGSSGSNTQGVSTIGDTIVAEDQFWNVVFTNLADEDTVSVTVNGTAFALQMGVAPDGTAIAETDAGFIARLRTLINTSADKDTLAGELLAAGAGTTLTLTQVAYNGGQNVYMDRPVVALGNGSGGEPASVAINKTGTNSEITLADYDGRNAGLTAKNVLFVGGSGMNEGALINEGLNTETMTSITGLANTNSRSVLATALAAGGTLNGSNALVLDSMTDVDTIATDFSLHGDDYLIGGVGSDTMVGGTGDDRFEGSKAPTTGGDVINGGKDLYVVRTQDGAAVVETVETLNTYEASVRRDTTVAANANVLNVLYLEEDTAAGATDGFLDTLVFNRNNFDATTNFYITVGRAGDTNLLQQRAGGEGTVLAGTNITATATAAPDAGTTAFTEMEAIRTLSGNGTHAGQGKDTVDLSLVSNAVVASYATAAAAEANAALVTYNLTTALGVIGLHFDGDANDTNNVAADNIANFLSVDGVENVVGGAANDLVNIDQAEVLKDNTFVGNGQTSLASSTTVAGVNGDRIVYDHSGLTAANRPFLTVTIEGTTNTDTVAMKGGVVGNDATTDTLIGVETITLADAAQGLERDTLVTSSVAGGVVNFQIGKVLTTGSGATLVDIVDMTQLENVVASTGADTIVVGNTMTNSLSLAASVAAVNNNGFTFFGATTLNSIQLSNQGLYSFDFTGAATTAVGDTASDTIDYRAEGNQDIAVVLDLVNTGINSIDRVVVASTDIDVAANLSAVGARVDVLRGADRFFAGSGDAGNDSVIDLSQHAVASDITVTFSANVVPNNNERLIDIRVSGSSIAKQMIDDGVTALERTGGSTPAELVLNPVGVQAAEEAYWNRIQGNAGNETINLTDYVSGHAMAFNLGAGANVVNYNPATIGTSLNMANVAGNATSQTFTITTTDNFAASATHTATGSVGSVRVQGSSVGTDYINLSALNAAISYTVDLKIAEGSGVIGNIIAAAVDVNADGDTTDAGDFKAFTTVVSGYENISGNNAANTYILNTAVNNVYMGNGNDTLTVTLAEDLAGDTIVGDSQGGLAATQAAVVGGTLAAGNMDDGSDTIKFTGNLTDGTYTFVLGNGTVDQFTLGAGSSSAMYGFENIDASGATDTNDVFVLTASTVGGPVPLSSILRGGAGNDTLTAGASITSTILDGGAGADTIAMGAFTGVVAQYEFGDSNSASKDTVTGFTTTVDAFEIKVDMAARGMTNVSGSFATGATGSRVLTSGIASSFYDTTLTQLQVDMNADGINDATGDLTITSAGAVAAGDVRYTITGTDAANVISGGSGNDTILGGAGNDTLSGGAGSSLVMSFELVGVVTGAGGNVTIGGQVVVAATGVGPDTVGAAFAAISPATYALGFVTGTAPTAVSYNAGTNQLSFTFAVDESASVTFADIAVAAGAAGFSVAAPTLVTPFLAVGGGVDTITGGAGADTMTGGALGDVFAYGTLATASAQTGITLATADTITDFATGVDTIKMGTAGGANYTEVAAAASFAAATTAANVWFAAGIGARAYYLTDTVADGGLLFIDSNLDGTADALIKLTGVTSASFAATDIVA